MKRLILSAAAAAAVLLGAAALLDGRRGSPAAETVALSSRQPTPRPESFVLSEYGGRIAVYPPEKDAAPREITSIWVCFLPSADRTELERGIPAADAAALAALLEDLGS